MADSFFSEPKTLHEITMLKLGNLLQHRRGNDKFLQAVSDLIFAQVLETDIETKICHIAKLGVPIRMSMVILDKVLLAEKEWSESLTNEQENWFYRNNENQFMYD